MSTPTSPSPTPSSAEDADTIGVLVYNDHRLVSDALATSIADEPGLDLLAQPFDSSSSTLTATSELAPDVVLVEVDAVDPSAGIDTTKAITHQSATTKVIAMSTAGAADEVDDALVEVVTAGAVGFLPKTDPMRKVLDSIRAAAAGELAIDSTRFTQAMRRAADRRAMRRSTRMRSDRLTVREREILNLLVDGKSNERIAADLYLSVHTIRAHVRNILQKLEVHSRFQAVAWAIKNGVNNSNS